MIKKFIYILFFVVLLIVLSSVNINAAVVIPNINAVSATNQFDLRIDGIENSNPVGWTERQNTQSAGVTQSPEVFPFKPFEGTSCLEIQSTNVSINRFRSVTRDFEIPLNLNDYNVLFFAVNMPELADKYSVTLYMYGVNFTYSEIAANLKSGYWNGVFFDISNFEEKNNIKSITINVRYETEDAAFSDYKFYIDALGAYKDPNITNAIKYLSSNYYTTNGILNMYENMMSLEITGANPSIETYSFNSAALAGETSIKLKFKNLSDCTAVTLFYSNAYNPWFATERSYILPVEHDGDIQTCYFPVNASSEQIRIVFNEATKGSIEIYSIEPVAITIPVFSGGTVDECAISSNKREINISGTITENIFEDLRGMRIDLYIFGMHEEVNIENRQPFTQTRLDRSFNFKIPLTNERGESYLCSKFVVAVANVKIDTPKCITNPEILANTRKQFSKSAIKKGMTVGQYYTEAQINGIKHTSVNIYLNRFYSGTETLYSHQLEGYTYYYSEDQVNRLDAAILNYSNAGISITAVLAVQVSTEEIVNRLLIHPDVYRFNNLTGYAFNTETAEGIRYLRAFCEFLVKRYPEIANYAVGSKVDNMYQNYNMGDKNLNDFVKSYATAVRIVYNTIRSVSTAPNIYISLSSNWDSGIPADSLLRYDSKTLIDALAFNLKNYGDINWNLVLDPSANEFYLPWNKQSDDLITIYNIELLCRYMLRGPLLYQSNATPRSIILLETRLPEAESTLKTAAYIYTYYKINTKSCSLIESYIIPRQQMDNDVIKFIDSNNSEIKTSFALESIGIMNWNELLPDYDLSLIKRRTVFETVWSNNLPRSTIGNAVLHDFSNPNETNGWVSGNNCININSGSALSSYSSLLKFQLAKNNYYNEYRGISNTFAFPTDLSCAPYISFDIQLTMLPVNVGRVELLVSFYSGDSVIELTGTVTEGEWNTVVCDISGFSEIHSVDRMKIWLRGTENRDLGDPLIFISNIEINSIDHDSDYIIENLQAQRDLHLASRANTLNMTVVWLLITVIIVASSLLVINILSRRKVEEENE